MKEGVHVSLEAWRSIMVPSHSLTSSTPLVSVYHVPTPRSSLLPRSIPFASHLLHSPLSKPTNLSSGIHSSIQPFDSSNKPIHSSIQPPINLCTHVSNLSTHLSNLSTHLSNLSTHLTNLSTDPSSHPPTYRLIYLSINPPTNLTTHLSTCTPI